MNSDPEAKIRDLLTWLFQDPEQALRAAQEDVKTASPSPTGQPANPASSNRESVPPVSEPSAPALEPAGELDPLDLEEIDCLAPSSRGETESGQSQAMPPLEGQSQEMGEIPTVQDRFQALLKHRLQAKIESNLPCFPWETEVCEYYDEAYEPLVESTAAQLWLTQLRTLNLPVVVPESVLAQLLDRCQEVVQSNLREGGKLVQAVASLFPDRFGTLNQLAGMVLVSPLRSGSAMASAEAANFPPSYEAASPSQQMVLSLLAARQIINDLTLTVSTSGEPVERQWLTSAGLLTLQAVCQSAQGTQLCLQAVLPCGGSLRLQSSQTQATAQRSDEGALSVALFNVAVEDICALSVQLEACEQIPLQFSVCLTD